MTRYIVQSGGLTNQPIKAEKFFNEIIDGLAKEPKILLCFFAEKREYWEEKYVSYIEGFKELLKTDVKPKFELALPSEFENQLKKSDVVCIYGGDDQLLMCRMKNLDLPRLWQGKTVATISAGSNMLAAHFWTCDWRESMDGFGILPIKIIPHYNSGFGKGDPRGSIDWEKAAEDLKKYGDKKLPVHLLEEGDYIVIET